MKSRYSEWNKQMKYSLVVRLAGSVTDPRVLITVSVSSLISRDSSGVRRFALFTTGLREEAVEMNATLPTGYRGRV